MKSQSRRAPPAKRPARGAGNGTGSPEFRAATIADYAALTFPGEGSSVLDRLGTLRDWLAEASVDYRVMRVAAHVMHADEVRMLAYVREIGALQAAEFTGELLSLKARYEGVAALMESATIRMTAGMARDVLLTGETR